MPCRRYSVVQTGPNTQLGGLKEGFASSAYQVGIAGVVKRDPIPPAIKGRIIAKPNLERETPFIH